MRFIGYIHQGATVDIVDQIIFLIDFIFWIHISWGKTLDRPTLKNQLAL